MQNVVAIPFVLPPAVEAAGDTAPSTDGAFLASFADGQIEDAAGSKAEGDVTGPAVVQVLAVPHVLVPTAAGPIDAAEMSVPSEAFRDAALSFALARGSQDDLTERQGFPGGTPVSPRPGGPVRNDSAREDPGSAEPAAIAGAVAAPGVSGGPDFGRDERLGSDIPELVPSAVASQQALVGPAEARSPVSASHGNRPGTVDPVGSAGPDLYGRASLQSEVPEAARVGLVPTPIRRPAAALEVFPPTLPSPTSAEDLAGAETVNPGRLAQDAVHGMSAGVLPAEVSGVAADAVTAARDGEETRVRIPGPSARDKGAAGFPGTDAAHPWGADLGPGMQTDAQGGRPAALVPGLVWAARQSAEPSRLKALDLPDSASPTPDLDRASAAKAMPPERAAGFWEQLITGLSDMVPTDLPEDEPSAVAENAADPAPGADGDDRAVLLTAGSTAPDRAASGIALFARALAQQADAATDPAPGRELSDLLAGGGPTLPGLATQAMSVPHASPPSGLTQFNAPQIAMQLSAALTQSADGATELALSPEELGNVRLRLERDAKQPERMVVHITFERPETLDLFRRHAGELAEALRDAGYVGADIGFGHQGDGAGTPDRGPGSGAPDYAAAFSEAQPAEPTVPRLMAGASLDLRL